GLLLELRCASGLSGAWSSSISARLDTELRELGFERYSVGSHRPRIRQREHPLGQRGHGSAAAVGFGDARQASERTDRGLPRLFEVTAALMRDAGHPVRVDLETDVPQL